MKARIRTGKLTQYIILLLLVVLINFMLPRLLPGSPLAYLMGEDVGRLSPQERQEALKLYNLDKPMAVQFGYYLKDLVTLDWGMSYSRKLPVSQVLAEAAPWTLLLAAANLVISTVVGSLLGVVAALRRKSRVDVNLLIGTSFLSSSPAFWIGMILVSVLAVRLGWFPVYGAYSAFQGYTGLARVLDIVHHLFLPLCTMVILSVSGFFLTMRYSLIEVLGEDFILMARAKGLPDKVIKYRYIIRNAMLPVFTVFMMDLGQIFSGAVVVETVFSYPGIGRVMYEAVLARDYPLLQYAFLIMALIVIVCNLLAELVYPVIDPRVVEDHGLS